MSTEAIERRLHEFVAEIDKPDWDDVLARAGQRRSRLPRRQAVLALAACVIAVAALAASFGLFHSSHPGTRLGPMPFDPLGLAFNRGPDGLTSIDVIVRAATLGGTVEIKVVRGEVNAQDVTPSEVVFQERVPMTNIASPVSGPPGTEVLSTWSGTLSTSDWNGGCQGGPFEIIVQVIPALNPTNPNGKLPNGEQIVSGEVSCGSG